MIREVDLVSYLPEFMQSYTEPVAALEGENPEFDIMWKAVDRVLCNRFIATADEYGISRFEKMLGIHPANEDTLESRRARVHSKWFNSVPYTWRVLLQKLTVFCTDTIAADVGITQAFDCKLTAFGTDGSLHNRIGHFEFFVRQLLGNVNPFHDFAPDMLMVFRLGLTEVVIKSGPDTCGIVRRITNKP